jgi:hypothetical protein
MQNYPSTIPIPSFASDFFGNVIQIINDTNKTLTIIISTNKTRLNLEYCEVIPHKDSIVLLIEPKQEKLLNVSNNSYFITAITPTYSYFFRSYYTILKHDLQVKPGNKVTLQQRHIEDAEIHYATFSFTSNDSQCMIC